MSSPAGSQERPPYDPSAQGRRVVLSSMRRRSALLWVVAAGAAATWLTVRPGGAIDWLRDWRDPVADFPPGNDSFPFDDVVGTVNDVPITYRALSGKRVRFRGYMFGPTAVAGPPPANQYQLVGEDFVRPGRGPGGPPLVQERLFATAAPGLPVYDQFTPVEVVGRLSVRIVRPPGGYGVTTQLFQMQVEKLSPAAPGGAD